MASAFYTPPRVTDHGSLVALTVDFDADFIGSIVKLVTLAQVSAAIGGDVLGIGNSGQGDSRVLGEEQSRGLGAGLGLGGEGGGGGKLPFTGIAAMAIAAVGAAVTSAGVAIKRKLRRPT